MLVVTESSSCQAHVRLRCNTIKAMIADELIKSLLMFAFKNFIEMIKMNIKDRIDESMI